MNDTPLDLIPDDKWEQARLRAEVLRGVSGRGHDRAQQIVRAAEQLQLTTRTIRRLLSRLQESELRTSSLCRQRPLGGGGISRLHPLVEEIISETIQDAYLKRQQPGISEITKDIRRRCRSKSLNAPAYNTVGRRVQALNQRVVAVSRRGQDEALKYRPILASTPRRDHPLEMVQIDHTTADVILVDERSRQPIGRPTVTFAVDECSRAIVGLVVSLEAPSSTTVALCVASIAGGKAERLARFSVAAPWTMNGLPEAIFVDNASEFHGKTLERGCAQYGVKLRFRNLGQKQEGGIVERLIGTFMRKVHALPGTTFSNVAARGSYDSDRAASLTLDEFEAWLLNEVCGVYHNTVHSHLQCTPNEAWHRGLRRKPPQQVGDLAKLMLDFLPGTMRKVGTHGVVWDRVSYSSPALSEILIRRKSPKYLVKRDPRDISSVWLFDEQRSLYIELPYRDRWRPPIALWEHKRAMERVRAAGERDPTEELIFQHVEEGRAIIAASQTKSRKARREKSRVEHLGVPASTTPMYPDNDPDAVKSAIPPSQSVEVY